LAALSPLAAAAAVPLALAALYLSRYASVGTLTVALGGALALGILSAIWPIPQVIVHMLFGIASTAAVVVALRPNLKRLVEGKERRITLR
jgi:glycerol-3-phosphate acyltransferase PlsY